jgi:SP family sugar:H+ symporter-like MFS transporter
LSLEQVDELYAKESKAWKSMYFVSTMHFTDVQAMDSVGARHSSLADLESAAAKKMRDVVHSENVVDEKY